MAYHKPTDKENILVDSNMEFENALPIVKEFGLFILNLYVALSKLDDEILDRFGITALDRDGFSIRLGDEILTISFRKTKTQNSLLASWYYEETQADWLKVLDGGKTSRKVRKMSINLEATNIKYIGELVNFSYSGNESEDDLEHYVDGLMPIPMKEIKYDEDYGRYNPMYKRIQERPHLKYVVKNGTYDYAYYNPDETPVELKPTIVTTYSSFDEARDEMQTVFEAFKQAWESYLRERLKNGQKSFYKSTNN